MRVVVTGASGNLGTSVLQALAATPQVESILGVARRVPEATFAKTEWLAADVASTDLAPHLRGADAVVHLAWLIQPSRDLRTLWTVNVEGSRRVFAAAAEAGVPALVYASSVGAYSPGPKSAPVREDWPTEGTQASYYARQKAEVEAILDGFEHATPQMRVVRMRPALIFKRQAASGIRRLFLGPLFPSPLARPGLIPVCPVVPGLRFQCVHSLDVGDAIARALTRPVRGAFNVAADEVLDLSDVARLLGARPVRAPATLLRVGAEMSWRWHLQPASVGWVEMALQVPLLDTGRAKAELGWTPTTSAQASLLELLDGLRSRAGLETPPLSRRTSGPARSGEMLTGIGGSAK